MRRGPASWPLDDVVYSEVMNRQALKEITIRAATNDDCDRIKELVSGVLAQFGLPFEPESKDSDLSDIEQSYLQSGGLFEVIEDRDRQLIGTYGLFPLTRETCELRKMYFVAEIRGRGLGKQVLTRAVSHARRLGFKTIVLETISVLDRAVRLYTHFGFVPMEGAQISARVDQAYMLKLTPMQSS